MKNSTESSLQPVQHRMYSTHSEEFHPEGSVEAKLIKHSHLPCSTIKFFDRQVCLPGTKDIHKPEMDLFGLITMHGEARIVMTELKQGGNQDSNKLLEQVEPYYRLISADGYLREDMARSYRKVIEQKQLLGLFPADILLPNDPLRVECLIIFYACRSVIPLQEFSECFAVRSKRVDLKEGDYVIPLAEKWKDL